MRRMASAVVLAAWALSSVIGSALDRPNEVSFKLYRRYAIVVRGSIDGLKNLNLLVDTGAVPSLLDSRIAGRLHLRGKPRQIVVATQKLPTERVTVSGVEVGPANVRDVSMDVMDLSSTGNALGTRVDAMIGFDVLGQAPFTIDYESRKLVFGPINPSFNTVSYAPGLPYAMVVLQIQQQRLEILVDTGSNNLVLFQNGVRECGGAIRMVGKETWTSMGGEMSVKKANLLDAYLGTVPWRPRWVYVPDNSANQPSGMSGLLGTVALGKRVAFDPGRRVLAWEPNEP